jgi:hypothetical protein
MSVHAKSTVSALALLAAALSSAVLTPHSAANAAATCLTAPNAPAPQGSHWYYRLERPSLRKCWRLVAKDRKEQRAAAPPAQPEPDNETEAAPAASKPIERAAQPEAPAPAPAPVITTLVTRNVSNTSDTAPLPPPAPPMPGAEIAQPPAPLPRETTNAQAPATPEHPVAQPVVASNATADASSPDGAPTWRLLLEAIALLVLVAGAAFGVLQIVRWRTDVLNTVTNEDRDAPVAAPARAAPTFAPLPPMAMLAREDDVDQALRRFAGSARRRAA